ncbi:MAG TPA: glycosyltransferase family A protein [Ignavibacteriaceae bacterium]|nr:glycosyltransferase family A protein [Ignavibacteriaceae bacterium]
MNTSPLVSVIITTYNSGKYIADTIKSVLKQTYQKFEIIIVDDGSTDDTKSVVENMIKSEKKISFHQIEHAGRPSVTRNVGIKLAKGEYIAFLDGDDLWTTNKLAVQMEVANNNPKSILFYSMSLTFGEVNIFSPFYEVLPLLSKAARTRTELITKGNSIPTSTVLILKEKLIEVNYFDEDPQLKIEDYDLWIRLGELGDYHFIPRIHCLYRVHQNQFSGSWKTKQKNVDYLSDKLNIKLPKYNFVRNRNIAFRLLRNIIHYLNYQLASFYAIRDRVNIN